MIAGPPPTDVELPTAVRRYAAGRRMRPVWANQVGGLTVEIGVGHRRCFLKWNPRGNGIDHDAEVRRLLWASTDVIVPEVIDHDGDDRGTWLVTRALPGDNAVIAPWKVDPTPAVRAIGVGLRRLHDGLAVTSCPFSWSSEDRIAEAGRRAAQGPIDPAGWRHDVAGRTVDEVLAEVADAPPVDRLVVCHGDACAPNTIVDNHGDFVGHVDLGSLGVADRWADLAVATWSTVWNYGPGWEEVLLDTYGVEPDPVRTRHYRLLWELGP